MKTTHTPGPWEVVGSPEEDYTGQIVADGRRLTICELPTTWHKHAEAERSANANLLAAAPDLLDIHRQHVSLLSGYSRWIGKTARERELIAAIKIVVEKSQDVIADAVEGTNAGCDKCGMADRVPGSIYCEECKKEEDEAKGGAQ